MPPYPLCKRTLLWKTAIAVAWLVTHTALATSQIHIAPNPFSGKILQADPSTGEKLIRSGRETLVVREILTRDPHSGATKTLRSAYVANQAIVKLSSESERNSLQRWMGELGGSLVQPIYGIPAYLVSVPQADLKTYDRIVAHLKAKGSAITTVVPNDIRVTSATPDDPYFSQQYYLHRPPSDWLVDETADQDIDAPEAWDITTGSSVITVAVLDTGVDYTHPDLQENIWKNWGELPFNGIDEDNNGLIDDYYGYNFYQNNGNPMDTDSHGTHVAGIIGARGNNGTGISGVCWKVRLMPLKCGKLTFVYTSSVVSSLYYAAANGAHIVNGSFGGYAKNTLEEEALKYITNEKGIIAVFSAGNDGNNNDLYPQYPASYPLHGIVSVTSFGSTGEYYNKHNYGKQSVDIAAPAIAYSTVPGNHYSSKEGTSMAAPQVSGVLALMKSARPDWSPLTLKFTLLVHSVPEATLEDRCTSGGKLNALQAIKMALPSQKIYFEKSDYLFYEDDKWTNNIITIRRNGALNEASVKVYALPGTASFLSDFLFLNPQTVHFQPGELEKTVHLTILDNEPLEGEEQLLFRLQDPYGAELGEPHEATITIKDDDPGIVQIHQSEYQVLENEGNANISVSRIGGSYGEAAVIWKTKYISSAIPGPDYTPLSGVLYWADGEKGAQTFQIPIANDITTEKTETFVVKLEPLLGTNLINSSSYVRILDNEPTQVYFGENSYTASEASESFTCSVLRKGYLGKPTSFQLQAIPGTADTNDYGVPSDILQFSANTNSMFLIPIGIEPDNEIEENENFTLTLKPIENAAPGNPSQVPVTILEGAYPGTLQFSESEYVTEEYEEYIPISVARLDGIDGPVSVDYQVTSGTALSLIDFIGELEGTLHWDDGISSNQAFDIVFVLDGLVEPDETIHLKIFNPQGGAVLGDITEATLILQDSDG